MNNQLHNQIKQLSDRELLEGIYQMLLVVMQEQLISDSKQLGINVIADLLVDNMYRNRERNENNNNAPYLGQQSIAINPFLLNKVLYDQRKVTSINESFFNIYNENNKIAYNSRNVGGVTYIDGTFNDSLLANDLLNTKHIITIVNDGADENNTISPIYFSTKLHNDYFANLAFYGSIGFDSVPTKQNDGFTEQDLIDYVLENLITK